MIGENLNYRISNATLKSLTDTTWLRESHDIEDFLRAGFQKGYSVSEVVDLAPNLLGYHIDPDSFVMVTEYGINEMGENIYPLVHRLDDIGLYEWSETGVLTLKDNYREIYYPRLEKADRNDIMYNFSNSDSASNSSDTASNNSDDINNSSINKYEIILGAVIIVITLVAAWYLYKSIKESQKELEDTKNTTEDHMFTEHPDHEMLNPYENLLFYGYILKLVYLLIPVVFVLLYYLRYYYFYRKILYLIIRK